MKKLIDKIGAFTKSDSWVALMLIYQGIIAFELWNPGVKVPEEVIRTARQMMTDRLEG